MLNVRPEFFMAPDDHDCGCGCHHEEHEEILTQADIDEMLAEAELVEIISEDGEKMEFYIVDEFDFKDEHFLVMIAPDDPLGYFIVRDREDEDAEFNLETLDETEDAPIYAYYEELLDEAEEWEDEEDEVTE